MTLRNWAFDTYAEHFSGDLILLHFCYASFQSREKNCPPLNDIPSNSQTMVRITKFYPEIILHFFHFSFSLSKIILTTHCTGFNNLPNNIRETQDRFIFKKLVKNWIWDEVPSYWQIWLHQNIILLKSDLLKTIQISIQFS